VIEIDPLTHNIHVLDYAAVDDCGRVINHTIVKGQVIGAAAHGLGAALMENLKYDEAGNLLTTTFSDYCPITILNMPQIKYGNKESPSPFTYNGAKGMGEGGGGPIFALSSALQDAVAAAGLRLNQSHYSPSDLYEVMQQNGSGLNAAVTKSCRT
jgi:2-furoyl-CoA dehydrogenase large subunit